MAEQVRESQVPTTTAKPYILFGPMTSWYCGNNWNEYDESTVYADDA